jgi:ferredoxin/flavodoxin---NADP+ reductase
VSLPACNATVIARRDLSDGLAILRVRPDDAPIPDFVPGQFIQLGLPCGGGESDAPEKLDKRAYSIASPPTDKEAFELLIALVPGGQLTPSIWDLRADDSCWIDPRPLGSFTLEHVPPGKDLVLVATGTGIAPYVSMLRSYALGRPLHRPDRWQRCVLVHGARRASDLAYAEEIRALCAVDPSLAFHPTLSREPELSHWSGLRGRVQSVLSGELGHPLPDTLLHPERCHVFLCGNPSMIEEVRAMLVERGFTPGSPRRGGNLHTERYW